MKRKSIFLILVLLATSTFIYASQILTAPLNGSRIRYVAQEGSVVKQGEILVKYGTTGIEAKLNAAQAELAAAEENLKDKEGDYKRYQTLKEGDSVSAEKLEDTDLALDKARMEVTQCKAAVLEYQNLMEIATIKAPYDCKVAKNFLAPNSGTEYGLPILELDAADTAISNESKIGTNPSARTLTSPLYGGVVTYTANEGQTVKKGEVLAKIYNPGVIHTIDYLKEAVSYSKHNLTDKENKFKRQSKLRESSATSVNDLENAELEFNGAKLLLEDAQLALQYAEGYNALTTDGSIVAPYDCRITKVLLINGSGTEEGTPILELEPTGDSKGLANSTESGSNAIGGTINDGYYITDLPNDGDIVKKDSPLVKYVVAPVDIEVRQAQIALDITKAKLKDAEGDYKRCKYLADKNADSKENCGDSKLAYEMALDDINKYQAKLDSALDRKTKTVINAPYDCKVTKVLLVPGSGTTYGTHILEIEKL